MLGTEAIPIVGHGNRTSKLATTWMTHCEAIADHDLAFIY
jgi:hypothetical protein